MPSRGLQLRQSAHFDFKNQTDFKKWVVTVEQVLVGMCPEPKGHTRSFFSGLRDARDKTQGSLPWKHAHPKSQLHILLFFKHFFNGNHFESLCWICYNIASFLCFGFFWPSGMWDLRLPNQGLNLHILHGRGSLTHWTAREVCMFYFWFTFYEVCVTGPWRTVEKGEFPSVINADDIYGRAFINI